MTFTILSQSAKWTFTEEAGKTSGKTVHLVQASAPTTPGEARNAPGLIARGDNYPGTSDVCWCTKRETTAVDDTRMLFKVECDFDSTNVLDANPLLSPTKVSYSDEQVEETYFEDEGSPKNKAIFSNNRPFPELPKRDSSIRVITLVKNVDPSTTITTLDTLRNTVNSAPVTIKGKTYAAGELKVTATSLSEVKVDNGTQYCEQSVTAKHKIGGWSDKIEGRDTVDINGNPKPLDSGMISDAPYPLTADGEFAASAGAAPYIETMVPYKKTSHDIIV